MSLKYSDRFRGSAKINCLSETIGIGRAPGGKRIFVRGVNRVKRRRIRSAFNVKIGKEKNKIKTTFHLKNRIWHTINSQQLFLK